MKSFRNLSIRTKLFLISVIPSAALVFFIYLAVLDSLTKRNTAEQVFKDCEVVERLSALLHELQQERGVFLGFYAGGGEQDRNNLRAQVERTESALVNVQNIYQIHKRSSQMLTGLDSLDTYRADSTNYPNKLNEIKSRILSEIYNITRVSQNPDIKNKLEAHLLLLYTKEYFARTKNILLPFFIEKDFSGNQYANFARRLGQYELSRNRFQLSASSDLLDVYRKAFSTDAISEVHAKLDSLFVNPAIVTQVAANDWWNKSMTVINALAETERYSLLKIRERADEEMTAMNKNVTSNVVAGVLVLLAIALLISFTLRQIVSVISELKNAARKLALGEVNFNVAVSSQDEMGELAASFNRIVEVIKEYAHTAHKIGKGDYEVPVAVRSANDILGIALENMKNDLQRLSRETELRTWLLSSSGQLNDKMRGEKEVHVLANEVIGFLTESLNAQIGALYLRENGHLALTGKYAWQPEGHQFDLNIGQGLVGQAAADGKKKVLTNVPDNYVKINSALGEVKPRNIIVYPFKYEDEVKGVLEIGSTEEFTELHSELLDMVNNHIGIAMHATQARDQLKQLLEETQRQSEELEAQQEELKQFNEELVEKTHLLEKSQEELKAQQEELQLSNEELIEKAALLEDQKQNLEFTKARMETKAEELALASQYKSEFLSNMSHELRTPLNSILILAQVLMENRNKTLSSKEMKFAQTIFNSGNDLLNLINDILDLSKVEAGKMELDVAPFALEVLVQDITNSFEELAQSKKVKFAIKCAPQLLQKVMVSDSQRLSQVLKNFLSNAFKFTPAGGKISLSIDHAPQGISFRQKSLQSATEVLSFSVNDSGIGIPEEKLSIIFEAFQQVDGSTKRKYGGTGLGLSISRELANLLGGEIHVSSQVGAGSKFTLFLPLEIPAEHGAADDRSLVIHSAKQPATNPQYAQDFPLHDASHYDDQHLLTEGDRKILIMEDDVAFAKVLLEFVHERNYKGIIAHQGNVGLSYARHYKPDAIILDMKLPVVDGTEVLKKLKSDPDLRHIPVQIISGHDFRRTGLELGAIDFIQKPITREAFWKALDKVENFVSRKPKKLLIIEDNHQHNKAVQELIGNGDVKCYAAYSGTEAYELLAKTAFDCIIVDLGLPDMTGFHFLEKVRQNSEINRIPVIVYTGKDLTKEENARLEKLASTVVLKTAFSHERLLDETTLFLHRVESKLPREKQNIIRKLHKTDEVLKNKRILIADDDDRNVYSLLSALEPEGMKCFKAANGKEAVNLLSIERNIDLILMDVMMPEMDGFEATRLIREMPEYRKIPIIALTAKAMKDDREKCLAAGMSDYISKPLNVQQLLSLLRVWLYA